MAVTPNEPGKRRRGGRVKGTPNKVPAALKDMILQALANVGGVKYLEQQAKKRNPAPFLALVGKVLPLQVKTDGGDPKVPPPERVVDELHP